MVCMHSSNVKAMTITNTGCFHSSRVFRNTMLAFLFLVLATCFLVLYRAKPLVDIGVEMGRVLASDKELIFDLRVKANNWNWWTVRVADADISMFAFSQVVPMSNNTVIHGKLGSKKKERGCDG